jgi:hypothetical protein
MKFKTKVLSRKYGGGGGGTQTVSTIPEWARPYLQDVGNQAQAQYRGGNLGQVAGASQLQQSAFRQGANIQGTTDLGINQMLAQQGRLTGMAASGGKEELMDATAYEAAKAKAGIDREAGAGGVLGSARTGLKTGAMEGEMLSRANQQVLQNKLAGEQALGQSIGGAQSLATGGASSLAALGDIQRDISQQGLDANWQALQRYASTIYGNPARQQTVAQGGK